MDKGNSSNTISQATVAAGALQAKRHIIAYFEPVAGFCEEEFTAHMDEIRGHGFNTVTLCLPEAVLEPDNRPRARRMVEIAHGRGLSVLADPWSLAGIFGGEAPSPFAAAGNRICLDNPDLHRLLTEWLDFAAAAGADGIFWDEPHLAKRPRPDSQYASFNFCECCSGREFELLEGLAARACALGLINSVCFVSSLRGLQKFRRAAASPYFHDIATDPYYTNQPGANRDRIDTYVVMWALIVKNLADRYGKSYHLWVQGFGNEREWQLRPETVHEIVSALRDFGVRDIAFWGFRACEATPAIRSEHYKEIWAATPRAFALA